jgi:U3 small nucleolar RNA-associated protein 7
MVDSFPSFLAAEVLLPGETGFIQPDGNEKTYRLKQRDIITEVDLNTAKNAMDFQLTKFGPYNLDYSRNGR